VPVDYGKAVYWARRGAVQGYAPAQADLAYLYEQGKGVTLDYGESYMWYSVAAAKGDKKSASQMKALAPLMRPQQLTEAKTRASAWMPSPANVTIAVQGRSATSFLPGNLVARDF